MMTNMASLVSIPGLKLNCPSEMLTMSLSLWSMTRTLPGIHSVTWQLDSFVVAAVHVISLDYVQGCI